MTNSKNTGEKLPEYYHQWNADERFPDLKEALHVYTVELERSREINSSIDQKVCECSLLMHSVGLLNKEICDLQNNNFTKEEEEAFCRADNTFSEGSMSLSENYEIGVSFLRKQQVQLCLEVAALKREHDTCLIRKDSLWSAYRKLDDSYQAKFNELKKQESE
jgi:hypothetical protein